MDRTQLLRAVETWGEEAQVKMMIEECLELATILHKARRKNGYAIIDEIIDEVADVCIMMEQAKVIFNEKKIEERIQFKLDRLKGRLDQKEF